MTRTTELAKPLLAVAGAGDLALSKIKEIPAEYQRLQEQVKTFDPTGFRALVDGYAGKAADAYGDLAERGERLVSSVRRQPASQDLVERADEAQGHVKSTRGQAKATASSARKTADAAKDAAQDATDKLG